MISSLQSQRYLDVYTSMLTISFIDIPTWYGQQRGLEVLFQFYIHFIGKGCPWLFKKFKLSLFCNGQLCQQERPLLGLVSFQVFRPSPYTTCFMLLVMGLDTKFLDFSSQGSPLCVLHFQIQFWFLFGLQSLFLFSCSLAECFSFIYLLYLLHVICGLSTLLNFSQPRKVFLQFCEVAGRCVIIQERYELFLDRGQTRKLIFFGCFEEL